ncbi:hypothetical protein [Rugosimonospora africana]|uniref:hypothetical protein n=1 Tax=Rugosimonospora africana TaxID=556532 RepID=UPI001EF3A98C|nr:hypothetical protein [Rugosimonospora africana]
MALHIAGRTLYGAVIYRYRRPWRGPVALLVLAAVTLGLLLAPPLVVAIAVVSLALGLTISWRRATVNAGQPRD